VQLSQVHRYSFAGGSVEACARFEAVTRLSIEVGSEGWRYHERGGGRQEWDRGVEKVPLLSLSPPSCWVGRGTWISTATRYISARDRHLGSNTFQYSHHKLY
jgi:hypothetical protein